MSLQPIENKRLYQQVAEQIASLIREGEWVAGSRLPSERAMAQQLGVSRPTVREAVLYLEIVGLVEVRTGAGIYVKEEESGGARNFIGQDLGPSPYFLMDSRMLIECGIAAQIAETINQEQLDGLLEAIEKMEEDIAQGRQDVTNEDDGDLLFHSRLAEATGNPVLKSIVDQLLGGMRSPMFRTFSERMNLPDNAHHAVIDHRSIYNRLKEGDADGARRCMRRHLEQVMAMLFEEADENGEITKTEGGLDHVATNHNA